MKSDTVTLAEIRFDNAMALFDEFVHSNVKHADAATLRGLEGRFALTLQIQPSYWSQLKARTRQIGEHLARQFERLCNKPVGWLDERHHHPAAGAAAAASPRAGDVRQATTTLGGLPVAQEVITELRPRDDDEAFITGLVLTYYRRHPQRARERLLALIGEALLPAPPPRSTRAVVKQGGDTPRLPRAVPGSSGEDPSVEDARALWMRTQADVAPLKRKR